MTTNEAGSKRVAITGATGLIGSHLAAHLVGKGWQVLRLVRRSPRSAEEIEWSPAEGRIDAARLEGLTAVVHLAAESLAGGRWTKERKRRILDSRVDGTRTLARAIQSLSDPPKVWLSASAIGYYGDSGANERVETSPAGEGFLSQVCVAWEQATQAAAANTRVVRARFGIVLSKESGALATMLPFFKLGLGGKVGNGRQYMSWISMTDLCRAIEHCLEDASISGPVNVVGPEPVTNAHFTRALGACLGVPAILPIPTFAVKLRFGEFAAEALSSLNVKPSVLLARGFSYEHPTLEAALESALST